MRRKNATIALLTVCLCTLAACGETPSPGTDGSHHVFNDATVLDASPIDGAADAAPQGPACSDGVDNDEDGLTDYPEDPGCSDASDLDESNPPFCGLDSSGGMIEIRQIPPTGHLVQNTDNGHEHHAGSCGGAGAAELVFSLTIAGNTSGVQINTIGTPTLLDTVVYVRKDNCDDPAAEVACAAPTGGGGVELDLAAPEPGEYFIFVDGATAGASGQFLLEVRGLIPEGSPCDPLDQTLVCTTGLICVEPDTGPPTVCTVPRCSDGLDNDGDSIVDFPSEPGCESALDHTEEDTCPGVGCPQCADGVDNDSDGLTDWPNDPGCTGAGDQLELDDCLPGLLLTELPTTGVHTGPVDPAQPSLAAGSCLFNMPGPEQVYPLVLPHGAVQVDITMSVLSWNAYPNIFVRAGDCANGTELGCVGNNYNGSESLTLTNLPPDTYYIFADTYEVWGSDTYDLSVQVWLPAGAPCDLSSPLMQCGNGGTCQDVGGGVYECVPTLCNNGVDDDGDGHIDYPNDPGCTSLADNDEADSCATTPSTCPVCFNGADDDGDGLTDYPNDPGCESAADGNELDACVTGLPLTTLPSSGVYSGPVNAMDPSLVNSSCQWSTPGPEAVYPLELPYGATQVEITMTTMMWNAYPNIFVRAGDCATGTELGCVGNNYNGSESLSLTNLPPDTYFIFADTYEIWGSDTYTLTVQAWLPAGAPCDLSSPLMQCGNGGTCQDVGGGVYECVPALCNNGLDDDGDGHIDYPNDPGCTSLADNDEADSCATTPSTCPVCFNGLDDDGDGLADFPNDPGCLSAADGNELDACMTGLPLTELPSTGVYSGPVVATNPSLANGSCQFSMPGPEVVFPLDLPNGATQVSITMTTMLWNAYPNIFVRAGDCATGTEQGCVGNNYNNSESLILTNLPPNTYFIFADTYEIWGSDTYTLTVQVQLPLGAPCDLTSPLAACAPGGTCQDIGGGVYQCAL